MIYSGRIVEAPEAHMTGLADAVFPVEIFMEKVMEYAFALGGKIPDLTRTGKVHRLERDGCQP